MIVTANSHPYARVFLNGVDVSRRCFYADDVEGLVKLWVTNKEGHILDWPAVEERGTVVIDLSARQHA